MNKLHILLLSLLLPLIVSCGNIDDFPAVIQKIIADDDNTDEDKKEEEKNEDEDKKESAVDDIVINEKALAAESETVIKPESEGYKDFIENFKYDDETQEWDGTTDWREGVKSMEVTFSDNNVTYTYRNKKGNTKAIDPEDFSITKNGADITIVSHTKCHYILKGSTTNGSFKIYSDKKFILSLNGVSITNTKGSAINIQKGIDGGKRCFLVIEDGTRNFLSDGAAYSTPAGEDEKGVIFSEGRICVSGNGYLSISGKGKCGIASDDYVYLHKGPQITLAPAAGYDGIKTNDGVMIAGGVLNITCGGNAAKGINTDGIVSITGGRTTIINSASKVKDEDGYSQPYCIKTDSVFSMTSGTLLLSASKSEDGNGLRAKQKLIITGGTVRMFAAATPISAASASITQGTVTVNGEAYKEF